MRAPYGEGDQSDREPVQRKRDTGPTPVARKETVDMKTLIEIESVCSRILRVLEHEDLRSGTVVTLSSMLIRVRSDLEQ